MKKLRKVLVWVLSFIVIFSNIGFINSVKAEGEYGYGYIHIRYVDMADTSKDVSHL